jgi:hypothetical protein
MWLPWLMNIRVQQYLCPTLSLPKKGEEYLSFTYP